MPKLAKITPCLWFDDQAEQAAQFYMSVFANSKVTRTSRYGKAGHEIHGRPAGSVMTVEFELDGHPFTALNGGPHFTFNEAVSLQVQCETQEEIDYFWDALGEGGDPKTRQCGWLKDRFGLSWQVVARNMDVMFEDPASEGVCPRDECHAADEEARHRRTGTRVSRIELVTAVAGAVMIRLRRGPGGGPSGGPPDPRFPR